MKNIKKPQYSSEGLNRITKVLFMLYVILQPILDIYMCLFDEYIQIAGFSLATLLRFAMAFGIAGLVMINTRKSKLTLAFIIYAAAILVYTVIHHFNAVQFSVQLPLAEYKPVQELVYLLRICIPPALLYVIYNIKLTYKDIKIMLVTVSAIMSSVIIVSNLLEFGHVAYVLEKRVIEDSMIAWFTGTDASWILLTCRGLFQWTNQISAVMLIILPFLAYTCLKEKKIGFWVLLIMHMIAMINIGTRIATVGGLLVLIAVLCIKAIEAIIHKQSIIKETKNLISILVSLTLILSIFVSSPVIQRSKEEPLFEDLITTPSVDSEDPPETEPEPEVEEPQTPEELDAEKLRKMQYIEANIPTAGVNHLYIYEAYPYTEDTDFWYHIIKDVPESERSGNRNMRGYMIDRILERDDRVSNYIWGISYTRSSSFVWPERDMETHFDSLGIVGFILFISPYFIGLIVGIWCFFKKFKYNLHLSKVIYLFCLGLGLVNSYFSGHVMNEIFPFVFLSLMSGMALNTALEPTEDDLE